MHLRRFFRELFASKYENINATYSDLINSPELHREAVFRAETKWPLGPRWVGIVVGGVLSIGSVFAFAAVVILLENLLT